MLHEDVVVSGGETSYRLTPEGALAYELCCRAAT